MKKTFAVICLIMVLSVLSTPVVQVQEAQAFTSLGCTTAADFGWAHWGWNKICYYEVAYSQPPFGDWDDW